jgi:hypothetical protein
MNNEDEKIHIDHYSREDKWVTLVIAKETGVVYHHQCGSTYVVLNKIEGFTIPIPSSDFIEQLYGFFEEFHYEDLSDWLCDKNFVHKQSDWSEPDGYDTAKLAQIVDKIVFWRSQEEVEENVWMWRPWNLLVWSERWTAFHYSDGKMTFHIEELKDKTEFFNLQLNLERWREALPGWIPVKTGFGPGVLMFKNYD